MTAFTDVLNRSQAARGSNIVDGITQWVVGAKEPGLSAGCDERLKNATKAQRKR